MRGPGSLRMTASRSCGGVFGSCTARRVAVSCSTLGTNSRGTWSFCRSRSAATLSASSFCCVAASDAEVPLPLGPGDSSVCDVSPGFGVPVGCEGVPDGWAGGVEGVVTGVDGPGCVVAGGALGVGAGGSGEGGAELMGAAAPALPWTPGAGLALTGPVGRASAALNADTLVRRRRRRRVVPAIIDPSGLWVALLRPLPAVHAHSWNGVPQPGPPAGTAAASRIPFPRPSRAR